MYTYMPEIDIKRNKAYCTGALGGSPMFLPLAFDALFTKRGALPLAALPQMAALPVPSALPTVRGGSDPTPSHVSGQSTVSLTPVSFLRRLSDPCALPGDYCITT